MADSDRDVPIISIPDLRDYERINAELVHRLDEGHPRVRLVGAESQRFLAARLFGGWSATIEIEGRAGPELAAELDAPRVTVVCHGSAADGAARGLRAGRVVILGDADDALAYGMEGGEVVVAKSAGHRAGLRQRGGSLAILEEVGRLAGERQSGGWLFAFKDRLGPYPGRGQRGGRLVLLERTPDALACLAPEDASTYRELCRGVAPWLPRAIVSPPSETR